MTRITLGHSPDPDDAFMFYALAGAPKVDTEGLRFEHVLADIQTCNERAERGELDVTALSLHGYTYVADRYRLTRCGASVGDDYGPLLVGNRLFTREEILKDAVVAIPGVRTTAALVLQLYAPGVKTVVMPFDEILPAVVEGKVEIGLLIHEGQITYTDHGVFRIDCMGEWWKMRTGLPLPLGVNAVRRDFDLGMQQKIQRVLRRSIEYGLANRAPAVAYAKGFGRGIDDRTTNHFVGMYVNDFTLDLGERGLEGVRRLLGDAAAAGLVRADVPLDFVPDA